MAEYDGKFKDEYQKFQQQSLYAETGSFFSQAVFGNEVLKLAKDKGMDIDGMKAEDALKTLSGNYKDLSKAAKKGFVTFVKNVLGKDTVLEDPERPYLMDMYAETLTGQSLTAIDQAAKQDPIQLMGIYNDWRDHTTTSAQRNMQQGVNFLVSNETAKYVNPGQNAADVTRDGIQGIAESYRDYRRNLTRNDLEAKVDGTDDGSKGKKGKGKGN